MSRGKSDLEWLPQCICRSMPCKKPTTPQDKGLCISKPIRQACMQKDRHCMEACMCFAELAALCECPAGCPEQPFQDQHMARQDPPGKPIMLENVPKSLTWREEPERKTAQKPWKASLPMHIAMGYECNRLSKARNDCPASVLFDGHCMPAIACKFDRAFCMQCLFARNT